MGVKDLSFFRDLYTQYHPETPTCKMLQNQRPNFPQKRSFLVATRAVTEAALATLGGLSLRDGDDVDGDGVEL